VEEPPKPLFRTPEQAGKELGLHKTTVRQYCKESGIYTILGKQRLVIHEDDITRLGEWIREHKKVEVVRSAHEEHGPLA
jgi:predicted site-specific integrase-resolvase